MRPQKCFNVLFAIIFSVFSTNSVFAQSDNKVIDSFVNIETNYDVVYNSAKENSKNLLIAVMSETELQSLLMEVGEDGVNEILKRNEIVRLQTGLVSDSVYSFYSKKLYTGKGFVLARNQIKVDPKKMPEFIVEADKILELNKAYAEKISFLYGKNPFKFNLLSDFQKVKVASLFPILKESELHKEIFDANAFWYDEAVIPQAYQDAVPPFTGVRPNSSDVSLGVSSFFQEGNFPFPLDRTAGTRNASGVRTVNVMLLPKKKSDALLPVVYYQKSTRAYYGGSMVAWTFPVGTRFVEVLIMKHTDSSESIFELRVVKKEYKQWSVEVFRPFENAFDLVQTIKSIDSSVLEETEKEKLITEISNKENLKFESQSDSYGLFHAQGASKTIPPMKIDLVKILLAQHFVPVAGKVFQTNGKLESYGPTGPSSGDSIVPRGYESGSLQIDSDSCKRCHNQTTRNLSDFDFELNLYGNVWGSDQRFSFHPFNPAVLSNGETMGESYSPSQVIRGDFIQAGILEAYNQNQHPDKLYPRLD